MSGLFEKDYYGDTHRWFVGVVEDVKDPYQLGRVRVRIRGLHSPLQSDIDTEDLPWAQVGIPTTEGGVSGIGRMPRILPGAEVVGFFLDGRAAQLPFVTHVIPKIEYASPVQTQTNTDPRLNRSGFPTSVGPGTGITGNRNKIEPEQDIALGAIGGTNAETAYNFFVANGFTPYQAAGMVGNFTVESGWELDTSAEAEGEETSYGIAQWNVDAERYGLLREFASDLGRPWTDLEVQLRFVLHELYNYPYLGLGALRASKTIEEAAEVFMYKYERPSVAGRKLSLRIERSKQIYKRMNS